MIEGSREARELLAAELPDVAVFSGEVINAALRAIDKALASRPSPDTSDAVEVVGKALEEQGERYRCYLQPHIRDAFARAALSSMPLAGVRKGVVEEAVRLAYGLLWHMQIDREDENLRLASDARRALLTVLSKDEQGDGIARAKATDARFTGAA